MGFDVGTVGNHEFDEGGDELLRLIRGGRRTGAGGTEAGCHGALVNTSSPEFRGRGLSLRRRQHRGARRAGGSCSRPTGWWSGRA